MSTERCAHEAPVITERCAYEAPVITERCAKEAPKEIKAKKLITKVMSKRQQQVSINQSKDQSTVSRSSDR